MIVTIHQPHYLPWLGYLHRMASADLFVLLDHVQFERGNYQNRTMVRVNGAAKWLTVPVMQRSQKERILDKEIDWSDGGGRKHFLTLRHSYGDSEHFRPYLAEMRRIYETKWRRLVDLNDALLGFLRDAYGIRTPLVKSSTLGVDGAKGELILNTCRAVGADTLLVGLGGSRGYLDRGAFAQAGIGLEFQRFTHPRHPQCGPQPFIPGLSALDMLFNCGPQARELLLEEEALVAA
ncbi:MAG: WbqC family protein [Betaproteobacteria bacterium]